MLKKESSSHISSRCQKNYSKLKVLSIITEANQTTEGSTKILTTITQITLSETILKTPTEEENLGAQSQLEPTQGSWSIIKIINLFSPPQDRDVRVELRCQTTTNSKRLMIFQILKMQGLESHFPKSSLKLLSSTDSKINRWFQTQKSLHAIQTKDFLTQCLVTTQIWSLSINISGLNSNLNSTRSSNQPGIPSAHRSPRVNLDEGHLSWLNSLTERRVSKLSSKIQDSTKFL